jgi:HlyD family secretion protein
VASRLGLNPDMAEKASVPPGDVAALVESVSAAATVRKRRFVLAAAAAAVLVASIWWLRSGGNDGDVTYSTGKVTSDRLVVTVNATGTLQPTKKVDVGSELSGIMESVAVDYNDQVTKGQVLARLDTLRLSAEALQSKAQLAVAEALLEERRASVVEAEAEMNRMSAVRKASGGRVPSQQDFDAAKATLSRARAQVASAEAQIELSRARLDFDSTNLAKAEIRSPIDGVVLSRDVEPGQTIAASLQAPKLFQLAEDLAKMELEVDVDEADVGQVRQGQEATFTVDAYPERIFPARITQLRFASETVNGVVTYKAVLQVANTDHALRPGMTATADIIVATVEKALLVPNEVLRFVPPQAERDNRGLLQKLLPFGRRLSKQTPKETHADNRRTVYRLEDGRPVATELRIGLTDGRRTEVVGGDVEEGVELILDSTVAASS